MSNKRINKAYIRYDGSGRVIPGALLLNRFKPTGGGKWHEIPAYECCNPVTTLALRLLFDDVTNANTLVGDASNVSDWNIFFDLPTYGNPFTSVVISGNEVQLIGGSNIETKFRLFSDYEHLLEVNDSGAIVTLGDETFGGGYFTSSLERCSLPNVTEILGDPANYGAFGGCLNLIYVNLPKCTIIGASTFYESSNINENTLILPYSEITYLNNYTFTNTTFSNVNLFVNVTFMGDLCFRISTPTITSINLPNLEYISDGCFNQCLSLTSINIPSCTNLGSTIGDDDVFFDIIGNTITLIVPAALMTCNAGSPDGDIQYLQANNTVTIVTV